MKYGIALLLGITALTHAEIVPTGSNDYYMTPPVVQSPASSSSNGSPAEQCWYEQVPITGSTATEGNPNVAGAIVGGIIGGVVGHQFGSGTGNAAATIGGAAIGTALGAQTPSASSTPGYQIIKKCNTIR